MNKYTKILVCVASCLAIGFLSSQVTKDAIITWYPTIIKPSFKSKITDSQEVIEEKVGEEVVAEMPKPKPVFKPTFKPKPKVEENNNSTTQQSNN